MKLVPAFLLLSSSCFVVWLSCLLLMPAQDSDDGSDSWQLSVAQLPMLRKLHGEDGRRPTAQERQNARQASRPSAEQCADERDRERSGKFFHVQYFSEHIGFAGDALRSVSNLAAAMRRTLIAPVVHNAHLAGHKMGAAAFGGQAFCLDDVISTEKLLSDGLTQSKRQAAHCGRDLGTCQDGWDALIVFQHSAAAQPVVAGDEPLSLASALKANAINGLAVSSATTSNTSAGWWDCTDDFEEFLGEEDGVRMHCQPNKTVFCIDSENQDGLRALDEEVLSNASCVNILSWSVVWNTWLPEFGRGGLLARSADSPGQRTRLGVGRHLKDKALTFKSANLGMTYVGVHVDLVAMALNGTRSQQAMRPLVDRVAVEVQRLLQQSSSGGTSAELLLATDVPQWSSLPRLTAAQRHALQVAQWHRRRVVRMLRPVMLDAVADISQRYLMEYELLAAADYLVTVGGSAAQMWIAAEFDHRHPDHVFRSQLRWEFRA